MNGIKWSALASVVGSTFLGGAMSYVGLHFDPAHIPSSGAQWEAMGLAALVAGVVAVAHLYQDPKPAGPS